jgi:hypothetical protein
MYNLNFLCTNFNFVSHIHLMPVAYSALGNVLPIFLNIISNTVHATVLWVTTQCNLVYECQHCGVIYCLQHQGK